MNLEVEAIYHNGAIHPLQPLELTEGERLEIVVRRQQTANSSKAAQILSEIALLPIEGKTDEFSGADHDEILYPKNEI